MTRKSVYISLFVLMCLSAVGQETLTVTKNLSSTLKTVSQVRATPDSVANGRFQIIYQNRTILKGFTKEGALDGEWVLYYPSGQQKMKGRFSKNQPHGEWTYWGEKGDVQAKFQFNKGVPIGHWKGYYDTHSKAIDLLYHPNGTPKQCVQYYRDDIISLNYEYAYPPNKTLETRSFYYQNYSIFHYEKRTNSVLDGPYISYYSNGIIMEHFNYEQNKLMDVIEMHSESGVPQKNTAFFKGTGVLTRYYPNGKTFSKTAYQNGLKNDSITVYDFGGSYSGVGFFKDNIAVGHWEALTRFHNVGMEYDFKPDSRFVTVKKRQSQADKEYTLINYKNGLLHGKLKSFNAYGELEYEFNYQYGFQHGEQLIYEGSKVRERSFYSYGNKTEKSTLYNSFENILSEETFTCETQLDTAWNVPPKNNLIPIYNDKQLTNGVIMWFYPNYPGMELLEEPISHNEKGEWLFFMNRKYAYNYTPILTHSVFPGGDYAEREYIKKNLKIPNVALKKKVEGEVLVRYKINHIGLISDINVLKTIGLGIDEQVIQLLKIYPPQVPALYNGIPIESWVVRSIEINI